MRALIAFCVHRRVFTSMMALIVLLFGLMSVYRLPLDLLPEVELPSLSVTTSYSNTGPEEMEELITRPIERAVAGVPGVIEMVSVSTEDNSSITLNFAWGTDLSEATNDVRDRLDRIINDLPEDADRPRIRKFDPNRFPILILGASSPLDPISLRRLLETQVQSRIEQVPGVAVVDIRGGLERELRVEIDPVQLESFGIPLDTISRAIREANLTLPAGALREGRREILLRTPALLQDVAMLENVIIARRDGEPVYLSQVATIMDTHRDVERIVRINGEYGVQLAVRKQSGSNTVEVARAAVREVERINRDFPQLNLVAVTDNAVYIERSLGNVVRAIGLGGLLAIVVLLFFLRSWRSTLIVATTIPFSLIATFVLVYFGNLTLNLMTLGGLALGVGMMVDNAIVVIETIFRRRENGANAIDAAIDGASEVAPAITASTLTTMAIFMPLLFLQGVPGLLFRQLALVIGFSLFCSLAAALTVVPMLAGHMPGKVRSRFSGGWRGWALTLQDGIDRVYTKILDAAFRYRPAVVIGAFTVFLSSLLLIPQLGSEYLPEADEGEVRITAEMDQGVRIEWMDEVMLQFERVVREAVPEAENFVTNIGASPWRPTAGSTGTINITLVPIAERTRSSQAIALDLQQRLRDTPGVRVRTRAGGGLVLLARILPGAEEGERMLLEIRGFDLDTLDALSRQLAELIEEVDGVTDVRIGREEGIPRLAARIDRERASDLGFSVVDIASNLRTAVGGSLAGGFRDGTGDEVDIRVRLAGARDLAPERVLDLLLTNDAGQNIALRNMVNLVPEQGVFQINRRDQQRIATVAINTGGRDLGSVAADVREIMDSIALPDGTQMLLRGDYEDQQKAFIDLMISLILALLLVYMVMACLYESLRDPILIMFTVPLAAIGALLALWLTGSTLNVQSFIGGIMLVGIVVNNAILIVDQANNLRLSNQMTPLAAVREAGQKRLRPILMTMLTTVLALLPLAFGIGEGSETQASLARAVVGGLFTSSLVTLVVIPLIYTYFHREQPKQGAS